MKKLRLEHQRTALKAEMDNRARSLTVGTCFGGSIEMSMRRYDGSTTFTILQPVEAIELVHQIAASVGCHIHIVPRNDFSSWRAWKDVNNSGSQNQVSFSSGSGHAPFQQNSDEALRLSTQMPDPEQQPGLQPDFMNKEDKHEQPMATEKTVNRRSTKRTAKAA